MSAHIEFTTTENPFSIWSPTDIREESPEDEEKITDETMAVGFDSGDGDGALVIGTRPELIEYFRRVVARLENGVGGAPRA